MKKKSLVFLAVSLVFIISSKLHAQDLTNNGKYWGGINLKYKINHKIRLKANQLFAYNASPFSYSFSQTKLGMTYKIKKRTYLETGYVRGLYNESVSLRNQGASPAIFNKLAVDRLYINLSYKHYLVKRLSLKHKFEYQYFFPDLKKYKTRIIYAVRLGYNVRKSSLLPYLESQFYYYQGGSRISDGFKRFRLKTGLSFKPFTGNSTRLSFYYMIQNEFNTEILRENDYHVIGTSLTFKLR